jgi:hypothetical protein
MQCCQVGIEYMVMGGAMCSPFVTPGNNCFYPRGFLQKPESRIHTMPVLFVKAAGTRLRRVPDDIRITLKMII